MAHPRMGAPGVRCQITLSQHTSGTAVRGPRTANSTFADCGHACVTTQPVIPIGAWVHPCMQIPAAAAATAGCTSTCLLASTATRHNLSRAPTSPPGARGGDAVMTLTGLLVASCQRVQRNFWLRAAAVWSVPGSASVTCLSR